MQVDAVVLAGGLNSDDLKMSCGCESEVLIPIGDRPMIEYVVNALKHTSEINRIVVAGPCQDLEKVFGIDSGLILAESGPNVVSTLQKGMEALKKVDPDINENPRMILITTGDIPMITPEAIRDFLHLCQKQKGDLFYPVVSREVSERKYPEAARTYVHLREGCFTGGNLFLIKSSVIGQCIELGEKVVRWRKKPLALSRLLGWRFVLGFLFHTLSLSKIEKKISDMLGIKGVAIISDYPEVGVDVDKSSDLQLARQSLEASC